MVPQSKAPAAPNPFAPRRYGELQKITERAYLMRNITNSTFLVGDESVAVIDTQVNRPTAQQLLDFIRSVTDKPVAWVINTHYHWDHTNGNQIFKDLGATVLSSKLTREFMVSRADRQKEFLSGRGFELGADPFLPEAVFEGEKTIDLGGCPLRLFFAGRAETDDATAVHAPTEGLVLAGDTVMTGSFPIFGQPCWDEGLQDRQWPETIAKLLALSPRNIIPGHGPLAGEADVRRLLEIENYFLDEVGRLVARGLTAEETLADLEPRLPGWMRSIPLVWGTPRYAILRVWRGLTRKPGDGEPGWQRFKPSAIPAPSPALRSKAENLPGGVAEYLSLAGEAKEGGDAGLRLAALKQATLKFPESAEALTAYAEALIEESRAEASVLEKGDFFAAARRAWDTVLAREPRHAGALLGKGRYLTMMAYRGGDDPAEGMKLLETVVSLCPAGRPRAEAEFYLGIGHRRLGDEARALRQFARALEFDPAFMPARLAGS
ncbi:MAG TPA: MBL fold metallo-hydrolase [Candidatus Eisenbacteria bacterium]|nr:MBL fold metallo-hydrolase [Candidatus Eisenbacteria bacterium]